MNQSTPDQPTSDAAATTRPRSVLLVEEQPLWRELLAELVKSMPGYFVAGSTGDRAAALAACEAARPAVALVASAASAAPPLDVAAAIKARSPHTHVLVLSANVRSEWVQEAVAAGVSGFVDTSIARAALRDAIDAVAQGGEYFSPAVGSILTELLRRRGQPADNARLSFRECQVLREIARGRISKEMAGDLGLSVFTIESIRRRIMWKTGLRSVAALTLHAMHLGLISAEAGSRRPDGPAPGSRRRRSR